MMRDELYHWRSRSKLPLRSSAVHIGATLACGPRPTPIGITTHCNLNESFVLALCRRGLYIRNLTSVHSSGFHTTPSSGLVPAPTHRYTHLLPKLPWFVDISCAQCSRISLFVVYRSLACLYSCLSPNTSNLSPFSFSTFPSIQVSVAVVRS